MTQTGTAASGHRRGEERADLYRAALQQTLASMPYNSATAYHAAYGVEQPDERLGAACILQSIDAAQRAHASGAPAPIMLRDERHVAAVFDDADLGVIVLDPYLMHLQPIVFPRADVHLGECEVEVEAAPFRRDHEGALQKGKLKARYRRTDGGFVIRLSTTKFAPSHGRYTVARHFTLRSSELFDRAQFTANLHGLLTHPEQTSVSVRALSLSEGATAEAIIPLRGRSGRAFGPADIWLRDHQGTIRTAGDDDAGQRWDRLEGMLGVDRDVIMTHLVEAANIYRTIANPDIELAAYSTEDE